MINTEKDIETLEMVYDALDNNRVKVFYQPQFDTKTCKLVSAEALCRIENEYHELILPGSFIPVLEKQESPDAIRNFDWYIAEILHRNGLYASRIFIPDPENRDEIERLFIGDM